MNTQGYALDGWILAQVEGKTYLGKPQEGWQNAEASAQFSGEAAPPARLSPVYEFAFMAVPTPQGVQMAPTLKNPFGCPSINAVTLPRPGVWVPVASLDADEQKVFAALVEQTEAQLRAARAQAAGISLVPAGMKLPPMPLPGNGGRR